MNFPSFFNPIAGAFRAAVIKLSKADGKAGLTLADFQAVIAWTVVASSSGGESKVKAEWVANLVRLHFGDKITAWPWIPQVVGWVAYNIAKRLNLITS